MSELTALAPGAGATGPRISDAVLKMQKSDTWKKFWITTKQGDAE
jgi:hypothetical protein